jgi:hypothetical protein
MQAGGSADMQSCQKTYGGKGWQPDARNPSPGNGTKVVNRRNYTESSQAKLDTWFQIANGLEAAYATGELL